VSLFFLIHCSFDIVLSIIDDGMSWDPFANSVYLHSLDIMSFTNNSSDNIQPSESASQINFFTQGASSVASSSAAIFPQNRSPSLPEHYLLIENDTITLARASMLMQPFMSSGNEGENELNSKKTDKKRSVVYHPL